jgi:dTDP-4-dehydrorhamnose reductase
MRKILITGASGLLGSKLMAIARDDFEVLGQYYHEDFSLKGCEAVQMDLRDREKVFTMVEQYEPDILVHAAALRDMDYCEMHKEEAQAVNVDATRNVVDICKEIGTKVLYVSTDVIFDGTRTNYKETDEPSPINVYAKTKLEGEALVLEGAENIVTRISFLYGWNVSDRRLNFVTWVLNNLKLEAEIDLYTDQYRNGSYMDDVARVFLMMYMRGLKGIYHVAGHNCLNRYEMGEIICEVFGYDKDLLTPTNSANADWTAPRPNNCCLDVSRAEEDLEMNFLPFREGLLAMKKQESEGILF